MTSWYTHIGKTKRKKLMKGRENLKYLDEEFYDKNG